MEKSPFDKVLEILNTIDEEYEEWKPLQANADKQAYFILGQIWESGHLIDADKELRAELDAAIKRVPEIRDSKRWSASGKSATEVILTNLFGIKHQRSRKSQWLSTLEYARECEVETTCTAFVEWIESKDVGGIEGAIQKLTGDFDEAVKLAEGEKGRLPDAIRKLSENVGDREGSITASLADADTTEGVILLLVKRGEGDTHQILRKINKRPMIEAAVGTVLLNRWKRLKPAQIAAREQGALLTLNRIAVKRAEGKNLKNKDVFAFRDATTRLAEVPQLYTKYFEAKPWVHLSVGGPPGTPAIINVANSSYHELDPGCLVRGAKPNAFVPYVVGDAEPDLKSANAYIENSKRGVSA